MLSSHVHWVHKGRAKRFPEIASLREARPPCAFCVQSWEDMQLVWDHTFKDLLGIDPKECRRACLSQRRPALMGRLIYGAGAAAASLVHWGQQPLGRSPLAGAGCGPMPPRLLRPLCSAPLAQGAAH